MDNYVAEYDINCVFFCLPSFIMYVAKQYSSVCLSTLSGITLSVLCILFFL